MKEGTHLILDLKGSKKHQELSSKKFIQNTLETLVKLAKMKAIMRPKVLYYEHEEQIESGVTGFVIIADSHICIHTYPFKEALYVDLFSCKKFDYEKVINYLKAIFNPKRSFKRLIKR
jgi:S-adenosylmethionine decarboxylase